VFGTLVAKEILETVLDLRFVVATLLCVILIPLGMYVSREDYEQRLVAYQQEHDTYRQRHGTPAWVDTAAEAHGFRPPPVLSIFASGLDPFLPDKVITSHSGVFRTVKEPSADSPQSFLFGKIDFLFNVVFVVSLAALIFTFTCISGEREKGTLRLMVANSIQRSRILLAKIVGKYVALLAPFMLSVLIALLILDASPDVSIASPQVWAALLAILGATLLFLLGMVCLGICISTLTRRSMGSIVLLFFVWVILVLGVPKISPMFAETLCSVESQTAVSSSKQSVADDIENEYYRIKERTIDVKWQEEDSRMWQMVNEMGKDIVARVRSSGREPVKEDFKELNKTLNAQRREMEAKYGPQVARLCEEYRRRLANEIKKVEQDHRNKMSLQHSIATNLSRVSPMCCYAYIVAGIASTGVAEPDNFVRNAQRYQDQMEEILYSKFIMRARDNSWTYAEGFDHNGPPVLPDMEYVQPTLAGAMRAHWLDLLLLGLFDVLFFALALMRFNKYDVR
jgi:ABC-type transport system involved in multi-copper enzyme maturation permease subunit